jgi:hypothetical protein
MVKRLLVCVPAILVLVAAVGLAKDDPAQKGDVEQQIKQLKAENEKLRAQVEEIDAKVQDVVDQQSSNDETTLDRFYNMVFQDEVYESGFVKKGGLTGTMEKLLNINLFLGARYTAVENESINPNDVDGFSIPFARLHLTGQAYTNISYTASFDFADFNDNWLFVYPDLEESPLQVATVTWSPDCPAAEDVGLTVGLTQTFLSPAGAESPWQLDFIEYPQTVYYLLPPGAARDVGAYITADFMEGSRFKIWAGVWNGAHRRILMSGTTSPIPGIPFNDITAVDAWGGGDDNDTLMAMGRAQLNILDEEEYFLMFSGGISRNRVTFVEAVGPVPFVFSHENEDDTIYNAAGELRFMQRKTWIKSEYMHARVDDTSAPSHEGYFIAAGHRLDMISEQLEVLFRYDRVKLDDHMHAYGDALHKTYGLNFFFDPDHKNDAKVQLNFIDRKDGQLDDYAFITQFVVGF